MSDYQRSHRKFRIDEKCQAVLRVLAGETAEALASELGASPERLAKWQARFVAGGREAIAKGEFDSHRSRGFFASHWTAILQWSTVILLLIVILATLTRIVSNSEP